MKKDSLPSGESEGLRHRAEKRLKGRAPEPDLAPAAETRRLLHELQVHQIELEMQNEELRDSRTRMETMLGRYTDLYDFAPVGYFTLSIDGSIHEVNLTGARLLGLERSRLIGEPFGSFVSQEDRSIFDFWLKEVFDTQVRQACEVGLVLEGRSPLNVGMEATLSQDGQEARTVVVDITARKALEEKLRQAQKMEVIGQLAGGVAHDFNNILAAMILKLEMLRIEHQLSMELHSSWHDLDTLAKRAANLTRQLLLFSRRQAMNPERLEINGALAHLLKMLERLLGEDITCVCCANSGELWIDADAAMLDQVVMNLCINARDAMPNGGTLTLETSEAEFDVASVLGHPGAVPGRFACVQISDTGCGMNANVLGHLFEPFFTTKEIGKGTGLGLASAYGIVLQHKGWMSVKSEVGKGSSFRLYLPLLGEAKAILEAAPITSSEGQSEMILVVEDEEDLLLVCARALNMFGYRVLTAANGREALQIWEKHHGVIDLVLTDMRMPNAISGLELAETFWKTKPSLKVIIMSGYSMETVRDSVAGNDAYTFLAKPFDLKVLSESVRRCLDYLAKP
jgi:PAS domain S-box-containing protein